jgi:hypothetical protein
MGDFSDVIGIIFSYREMVLIKFSLEHDFSIYSCKLFLCARGFSIERNYFISREKLVEILIWYPIKLIDHPIVKVESPLVAF